MPCCVYGKVLPNAAYPNMVASSTITLKIPPVVFLLSGKIMLKDEPG
ncbi:MAG: hypothetical protein QXJ63_03285 [Candidatus Bathyarchaeia archaeon]